MSQGWGRVLVSFGDLHGIVHLQAYTAVGLPAGDEQGLLKETPTSASAPVRVAIVEEDYDDETESMQIL